MSARALIALALVAKGRDPVLWSLARRAAAGSPRAMQCLQRVLAQRRAAVAAGVGGVR